MENKKTTELLDLIFEIEQENPDEADWDKYGEATAELEKRFPFNKLFGSTEYYTPDDMTHQERLESLEGDMKKIKRHKHDPNNGDVLIRI